MPPAPLHDQDRETAAALAGNGSVFAHSESPELLHENTHSTPHGEQASFDGGDPKQAPNPAFYRVLDIVISICMMLFLLPVFVAVAIGIVLADPGPVMFAHRRVGKGGKEFFCLKFRSMYLGAEERLKEILASNPELRAEWAKDQKLESDPRITRIGGFLRKTSLDEMPQLLNVLRGEMSLVGPRPIVRDEVARYGRRITSYYLVKPGLTGIWQVSGRSETTYRRRVAADVLYSQRKSPAFDTQIMLATIPAVLLGRGSK